jgi:uncharacterized membrane protein
MTKLKSFLRSFMAVFSLVLLVSSILFSSGEPAWAKRSSGRVGGSTFRAPVRSLPRSRTRDYNYYAPAPSFGGGWFLLPFLFGGGGGSLLSLLVLITIGGILVQAFRNAGITSWQSKVGVAKVQVGLLASARSLQSDLNRLAMESDTSSQSGLVQILQETTLALLRHPEYWVYGATKQETVDFDRSEQAFNRLAMAERSKQERESITNVNNRLQLGEAPANSDLEDPSEYIVVTIMVAATRLPQLPTIRSTADLRQALTTIGAVGTNDLLALEVIWEPQSTAYTLTASDMTANYPDLVRI